MEEFLGVPYSEVALPESFIEWDGYNLDNIDNIIEDLWEGGSQWNQALMTWIESASDLFEYFLPIIPKDIWPDFSMCLSNVVDYHYEIEGGLSFQLPWIY